MNFLIGCLIFLSISLLSAFFRATSRQWIIVNGVALCVAVFMPLSFIVKATFLLGFGAISVFLTQHEARRRWITLPILNFYRRIRPRLSDTERVALEAGTVGWEGDLFSGAPQWKRLLGIPQAELSAEERSFLDGPVEELCDMVDDWEITHELADLSPDIWNKLKSDRFFGMIIPKCYGGLEFSAYAHARVLQKVASASTTVASTIAVPNSLGPAELLLHYGTEDQKNHYLPRLAKGSEVPCFGLTGPSAGSDATSIPDTGIICQGNYLGEEVLGMKLNFDKRYITLAPVASVIGLAFRLLDPDSLIGDKNDLGITLCLLPRDTDGIEIGRRHMPLNVPFQNGPIRGTDVFVPLDFIIGGKKMAGEGWRMLVECLSVGRAISLPSNATGALKMAAYATGAYARIRKQFNLPIGKFEGIEEALARIGAHTYTVSALSKMSANSVDQGEKPSVPSAIAKYHATELSRIAASDAMDIHGGKGIILGPRNYLGRIWQGVPIGITVEGANILTRSMIIFGQGAIRCHPFVLKELEAATEHDRTIRLKRFDAALMGHLRFSLTNISRSIIHGLTSSLFASSPGHAPLKRYYQKLGRYSAALAVLTDFSMLILGGKLKFKEKLSARLGDILSQLYIASSVLKEFSDQGHPKDDLPMVLWSLQDSLFKIQTQIDGLLRNFPNRPAAFFLRSIIFPLGQWESEPSDNLGHQVASILLAPSNARDRLTRGIYANPEKKHSIGALNATFERVVDAHPIEHRIGKAVRRGQLKPQFGEDLYQLARDHNLITAEELALLREIAIEVANHIAVDDFDANDLKANQSNTIDTQAAA